VIQEGPERVAVRLQLISQMVPEQFDKKVVADALRAVFNQYGCRLPEVEVTFEKPESNRNSQKLIRIQRNFKTD
jgi:predicted component of type VI protein secretion system